MLVGSLGPDPAPELASLSWPLDRLDDALVGLGLESRLVRSRPATTPPPPADLSSLDPTGGSGAARWLERLCHGLDLEAEPIACPYSEIDDRLTRLGPALLLLPGPEPRWLVLVGGRNRGSRLTVLGPDRRRRRVERERIRHALCAPLEQPLMPEIEALLGEAGVTYRRLGRARQALLAERLGSRKIDGLWQVRPSPAVSFWHQLGWAGLLRCLVGVVGAHVLLYLLWILSWWLVGRGALAGRLDAGWLTAWGLLLIALVPLRLQASWLEGRFAVGAGRLLRRRLLYGALRLEPEEVRHQGAGQFLGRVVESEAVESLALGGAFSALVAVIELLGAAAVLALGAGGPLHPMLLGGWLLLNLGVAWSYYRSLGPWSGARLEMTGQLVESIGGYRTRLVQEPAAQWHDGEDRGLDRYVELSRSLDHHSAMLRGVIARGWLVIGLLGLAPVFLAGDGSRGRLAIALGGILLAYRALAGLTHGLTQLLRAGVAWREVAGLFRAARRGSAPRTSAGGGDPLPFEHPVADAADEEPLIEARQLEFAYPEADREARSDVERTGGPSTGQSRGDPVLQVQKLRLDRGERVLLQGPSGGGKSTLVALLAGLRTPSAGLLSQNGIDHFSFGPDGWRRRIAAVPQFHENHVLSETLAFNLLMGRRWPPRGEDLREAEAICRRLGLGPVLDRMPAGLFQRIGETGWQLSHGERSRLFIARALLQSADLILLDESFAALDPDSLGQALECVRELAPTLLVVAHP